MRYFRDEQRGYEVSVFENGLNEMAREIEKVRAGGYGHEIHRGSWSEGYTPVLKKGYMRDWADVKEAVATPWLHGIKVVNDMIAELRKVKIPRPESIRRQPKYNFDGGDEVDYDKLRSGQEFWRKCERNPLKGPQMITIFTDVTTSAAIRAEEILWRGAAALAITNILEEQGFRVELWSYQHCASAYTNGYGIFTAVRMKEMSKPLNVNALVCGVSGWFYRTMMFNAYYVAKRDTRPSMGLGRPQHSLKGWQRDLVTGEKNPIVLRDIWSKDKAVQLATQWIEKVCLGKDHPGLDYFNDRSALGGFFEGGGSFEGLYGGGFQKARGRKARY
jgi:hypothetical protein